jgi:hypothetical protein
MGDAAGQVLLAVVLKVILIDSAGVPADVLTHAQAEVSKIYAAAGVDVQWIRGTSQSSRLSGPPLNVIILPDPDVTSRARGSKNMLGVALMTPQGRGSVVYAFYARIEERASKALTDPSILLGHVLAHELGHLLLGHHAHSTRGIMNGEWGYSETQRLRLGLLAFTKDEASSIRLNIAGR